ncbi:hypothetical protein GO730_05645 [Spirosoma sp. HMF3257]|uniref:Uncharacterized protein n=1 Tax=Spirosoma telluris TaxID=2183553 RepID=A0A327NI25_9BACT|nr:hypothetical protein [Spirosoma telluris]RAI73959.1 hypothetical protein HMF3257_05605 [Spirosoma telluris]
MPKGYNNDGTKKVRPANSGRKVKEGKKIHSKLAVDVIQILSKLENPVTFIENAIREKAARGSGKRQTEPETYGGIRKGIQIDLMDMLEQINTEKMIGL